MSQYKCCLRTSQKANFTEKQAFNLLFFKVVSNSGHYTEPRRIAARSADLPAGRQEQQTRNIQFSSPDGTISSKFN